MKKPTKIINFTVLNTFLICFVLSSCNTFKYEEGERQKAIDIVCGEEVDKTEAYISKYKGKKYYFKSSSCKKTFETNQQKFIDNKCYEPLKK